MKTEAELRARIEELWKKKKGVWKGGKRNKPSFEGTQYEGGRTPKSKNLKYLPDGSMVNQHGVVFTPEERRVLESKVNSVNRKRVNMLKAEAEQPRTIGGKPTGQTIGQTLHTMGSESDFIISRRSKSLQRFKTKDDYFDYVNQMDYALSPTYVDDRTRLYKRNHMTAIENVFGDDAKDVVMKIRMMKPEEYRQLLQQDEFMEISYIYDPTEIQPKLNKMRLALGMKLKEV